MIIYIRWIIGTSRLRLVDGDTGMASFHISSISNAIIRAKDIHVPLDKLNFQFARSSGPGGQNVNKLNTKAEIRFHLDSADWIPAEVKARLRAAQASRISKDGELIIASQEHRSSIFLS